MTKQNLPDDFLARKVFQYLFIAELVALLPILLISFTKFASFGFIISFLIFLAFLGMYIWLYIRYQTFPAVKEKNRLQVEINKAKSHIQRENIHIQNARQGRDHLFQAEKNELIAALKNLQSEYIINGLSKSNITNAAIPGIGPKLKSRLASHNIHTAADVTEHVVTRINGFGAAKTQAILSWRNVINAQLEASKPPSLAFEQENDIKQEFQMHHKENDASEQKAQDNRNKLEIQLHDLLPLLNSFVGITFRNYVMQTFRLQGWAASIIATGLIISQLCLGATTTLGTTASVIPTNTAVQVADIGMLKTTIAQTVIANLTQTSPTLTSTSVSAITQTEIPLFESATETNSAPTFTPVLLAGSKLLIHVIDVGQGDSILIQTPEGKTILIDGGEASSGVIPYFEHLGITNIDVMVATHPHADHIGGLVEILGAIPVSKVITNGEPHTTLTYEHFLDAIATAKAEYVEVKRGDVISVGSINFLVLSPVAITNSDMNQNSVILRVTFGKTTILLMGDAGADTERDIIASGLPLKADILKVGHHGSKSASTPEFLSIVNPGVAIYSAGINNTYGHPAPEILAALSAVGATIYGTDQYSG